jgi:hypothetical protein
MAWYYLGPANAKTGPVSQEELLSLLDSGRLPRDTRVWQEGMRDWQSALTLPALATGDSLATLGYRCPYCERMMVPIDKKRIAGGAWAVFALLLITGVCIPVCWVPLVFWKTLDKACPFCGGVTAEANLSLQRTRLGKTQ